MPEKGSHFIFQCATVSSEFSADRNNHTNDATCVYSYAFSNRLSVAILRMPKFLDYSHLNMELNNFMSSGGGLTSSSSISNIAQLDNVSEIGGRDKRVKVDSQPTIMPADSYLNLTTLPAVSNHENGNRQPGKFRQTRSHL